MLLKIFTEVALTCTVDYFTRVQCILCNTLNDDLTVDKHLMVNFRMLLSDLCI